MRKYSSSEFFRIVRKMAGCEEAGLEPGEKILLVKRQVFSKGGRMLEQRTLRMPHDSGEHVWELLAVAGCRRVEIVMARGSTTYHDEVRIRWERVNW